MADTTQPVSYELAEQVRRLTEENERLRARVAVEESGPPREPREPRRVWRSVVVVVLLALATILAPAATIAGWARVQLTSADAFVDTFAPLADDPNVQALVTDQAVAAINNAVDIPGLTNEVFTGIDQIGLPPRAAAALKLLQTPATQGIQSFIQDSVSNVVTSAAFRDLMRQGLRTAHDSLVALQGDLAGPDRAVTISGTGEIGVQLKPIIAAVKARLVARGVALASNIPEIDKTIVVAKTDAVPTIRTVYAAAVAAGTWLPFVVLALFAGAVLTAARHRRALVAAAVCLAAAMVVTAAALGGGRILFTQRRGVGPLPGRRGRRHLHAVADPRCAAPSSPSAPSRSSSPRSPGSPGRRILRGDYGGRWSTRPRRRETGLKPAASPPAGSVNGSAHPHAPSALSSPSWRPS